MPTYVTGDIWQAPTTHGATVIAVPSNAVINRKGELVMGAGFALASRERCPWLPAAAGAAVCNAVGMPAGPRPMHQIMPDYGWVRVTAWAGLFQTKDDYRMPSTPDLIHHSAQRLAVWLHSHSAEIVALPMPGVGLGGLQRRDVVPVLGVLPERVIVFEREGEG